MILANKLNITDQVEISKAEEKLSKTKAKKLLKSGFLDSLKPGSFEALAKITITFLKIFTTLQGR